MLAAGKSNKEIGRCLQLVDGTVKIHVKGILRKLGANNRTQAVMTAARAGFLPGDLLG
jgi:DNA-binding NarL/FixJ family response regulator